MKRLIIGIVVTFWSVAAPTTDARADHDGLGALATGLVVGYVTIVSSGIAVGIVNTIYLATDNKPPLGWQIAGYALGTANTVIGGFLLAESDPGIGAATLAVGVADIALAIWGTAKPRHVTPGPTVGPLLLRDHRGDLAVGVSLRRFTF